MTEPRHDLLPLWTLRDHGKDVRCLRGSAPGALELRILWGDELFLTERFSTEEALVRRAEEFLTTLSARGWKLVEGSVSDTTSEDTRIAPAIDPAGAGPAPAPSNVFRMPAARPDGAPVVLVVDDEEMIRNFLREYFEIAGYVVRDAEDVDSALSVLDEGVVDAVVLDVRMPDRTGWGRTGLEVLAFMRLHAMFSVLPVLILTGYPLNDDERALVQRHRAQVFMKPDGYRMLLDELNVLTGHQPGPSL